MTGDLAEDRGPLRILIAALGGEGGGVLMNWIVAAGRMTGHTVQATSVPGVAQRTGSTSYYVEIVPASKKPAVLGLVPMPGRVDIVIASELVEAARVMASGFVSPDRTTLIASTARTYATAEKIMMGDGRFSDDAIVRTAEELARESFLLDLGCIADDHQTFLSATMFGALAGAQVLPWSREDSRSILGDGNACASRAGFDAACQAVIALRRGDAQETAAPGSPARQDDTPTDLTDWPQSLRDVVRLGVQRCVDFQDRQYADEFVRRASRIRDAARLDDHRQASAVAEACRRLALWMSYEDIARVADLKTRPERFASIRAEADLVPGQIMTVTEYLKPRPQEVADILPVGVGSRMMARIERGGEFPFLNRGRHVRSNGVLGYWMLRALAGFRRIRRRSYRYAQEQAAIEDWLDLLCAALRNSPEFAEGLAELPRVMKGYSDTLERGRIAYARILDTVVKPAVIANRESEAGYLLRSAIGAALSDETHKKLDAVLAQPGVFQSSKEEQVEENA